MAALLPNHSDTVEQTAAQPHDQLLLDVLDRLERLPRDGWDMITAEADLRSCHAEVKTLGLSWSCDQAVASAHWTRTTTTPVEGWHRAVLRLAGSILPPRGVERRGSDGGRNDMLPGCGDEPAPPRAGLVAALELLDSITAAAIKLESTVWFRSQATRTSVVKCASVSLVYVDSKWPWSDAAAATAASTNLAHISALCCGQLPSSPPLPCCLERGNAAVSATTEAGVFALLGDVLRQLHCFAGSQVGQFIALWIFERIEAYPHKSGEALELVHLLVPMIESSTRQTKLHGLRILQRLVRLAKAPELNWHRGALTAVLLRAIVFWEEDALGISVPTATHVLTTICVLHGAATSAEVRPCVLPPVYPRSASACHRLPWPAADPGHR